MLAYYRYLLLVLLIVTLTFTGSLFIHKEHKEEIFVQEPKKELSIPKEIKPSYIYKLDQTNNSIDVKKQKRAYMFYVTNKAYACCVMVFAHRFKEFKKDPSIDVVALVTGIEDDQIKQLNTLSVKTIQVNSILSDKAEGGVNELYQDSVTKFRIFDDWGYDRFVFIDADSMLMGNIDHLFDLPDIPTFWAPRAFWLEEKYQPAFSSILIVGRPSKQIFEASLALSETDNNLFDMDILNKLYRHQIGYLPNLYAILNSNFYNYWEFPKEYLENGKELNENFKLIHLTNNYKNEYGKPWQSGRERPSEIKPENQFYFDFLDLFNSYYDKVCPK
ncbi:hypothetical protein HK103_006826 [Boothiomyces macroporosus]|uniref:Uncharacterized protein n=1 Tax=Boothiomyces macroporosus TaxID=261099 RepID=A0AAD5UD84_9FUNG|nr:hypothetical protein HK103_006826 [Boothiomyces macroporosus]